MKSKNNLSQLKEKIQELVPEIMELKFGCKVKSFKNKKIYKVIDTINKNTAIVITHSGEGYIPYKEFEILGRPITLEDVLMAIRKLKNGLREEEYPVDVLMWGLGDETGTWEFGKPLDQQSEETINFLHSIICQK